MGTTKHGEKQKQSRPPYTESKKVSEKMASGFDNVSGRKSNPPVEDDCVNHVDIPCCVCVKKGTRKEASKYCVTCKDYFCSACVKVHELVPGLVGHTIIGNNDFQKGAAKPKLPTIPTERCFDHPAKIIDMYCETHEDVGCATCMATKHGESCAKLYIPEHVDRLFKADKLKEAEQRLRGMLLKLEEAARVRDDSLNGVEKLADAADAALEKYADDMVATINKLRKSTKSRLKDLREELKSTISDQLNVLRNETNKVKNLISSSSRAFSEGNNKSQQIVCATLALSTVKKCDGITLCLVCPNVNDISFHPHPACVEHLRILLAQNSLGVFSFERPCDQTSHVPYKVDKKWKVDVKLSKEKLVCQIRGSCAMQDGSIILADHNNRCLKRLSPNDFSVIDRLQLASRPSSICLIGEQEAAVTLRDQKEVQFVSIGKAMQKTRTMKTEHDVVAIAHHSGEIYVSDTNKTVCVYSQTGKLIRQLSRDRNGEMLFTDVRSLELSGNGKVLYVADFQNGLIAVDSRTGCKIWKYKGINLKCATSVCLDGSGSILVCGLASHNVIQVNESGESIGDNVVHGLEEPVSVSFDKSKSRLVVTREINNKVIIVALTAK